MPRHVCALPFAVFALLVGATLPRLACAQDANPTNGPQLAPKHSLGSNPAAIGTINTITNSRMLQVPLVNNVPGGVNLVELESPVARDPEAVQRGKVYFEKMNCIGCHANNGAGGLGPSLSDETTFKFGTNPAQLFVVIMHGAPTGMPAWGSVLPHNVIWDIVSYIESINKDPAPAWGRTTSVAENEPKTEQVPAEFEETTTPWQYLEKFSGGKKPTKHNPTSEEGTPKN